MQIQATDCQKEKKKRQQLRKRDDLSYLPTTNSSSSVCVCLPRLAPKRLVCCGRKAKGQRPVQPRTAKVRKAAPPCDLSHILNASHPDPAAFDWLLASKILGKSDFLTEDTASLYATFS